MTFSVIIPTHNRIESLKRSLQSVLSQRFEEFEVIVVNDGSTDGTNEYLSAMESAGSITYVKQRNMGPAAARNAGIEAARGSYLAFTDDDCVVGSNWLHLLSGAFAESGAAFVGGSVRNCVGHNIYSEVSQDIVNHLVTFLNEPGSAYGFLTSNNIAYRAEAVRTAGGFDGRFRAAGGEERALNAAILRRGGKGVFLPAVVVDHYHRLTARSFLRQQRNYGRGSFRLYHRQEAPPKIPFAAYATLLTAWLKERPLIGIAKTALFVAAQFSVACGYGAEALSPHRDRPERGAS